MEIGHKRIKNLMILKSNQVQSSRYLFLSLDLYHNTAIEIGRNRIKALYDCYHHNTCLGPVPKHSISRKKLLNESSSNYREEK